MEILIDSFLIFTCLMFWIMFYNKKGLLAEIQKTEKKISEKIIVLEDLLDAAKDKSLLRNNSEALAALGLANESALVDQKTFNEAEVLPISNFESLEKSKPTATKIVKKALSELKAKEILDEVKASKSESSPTLNRVLSLEDALAANFFESDEDSTSESVIASKLKSNSPITKDHSDSESYDLEETTKEETSLGVTERILEARENLEKIEISDRIQIKSFKDVVLMSKKFEMEKRK